MNRALWSSLLLSFAFVPAAARAQGGGSGPSDPEIAAIVVAANQVDVDAGKLAEGKAKSKEVKEFAKTMVRDHTGSNKQAAALCKKLGVTPKDNATAQSLKDGGKQNLAALRKLKGAAFDKAYVDHEVAYHQQVVDAVNNTLLPNAKNPELKALIEKTAPVIQAHLDHARQMQTSMGGAK